MNADLLLTVELEKATALLLIPTAHIIDIIAYNFVAYSLLSALLFLGSLFVASTRISRYFL